MSNPIELELLSPLSGQRQKGETDKAVQACNDWLRMGSGRSIPKLIGKYQDESKFIKDFEPPSVSVTTLATWSSRYDWPSRAAEYDAGWEARKNAEREAVIGYGLALDYERLRELYQLATFLKAQIYERDKDGVFYNIWMPDAKMIGTYPNQERVDMERFNPALIEQYRKVLEDIAKETGGRVQKYEYKDLTKLSDDELLALASGKGGT